MDYLFLRSAFSEIAKNNDFPFWTLVVILAVVAFIILLLYLFRHSLDEFLRISDAELYVNKKGSKSKGTYNSRTQSSRVLGDDPEKTTNMKTINLPRKKKGE